MTKKEKLNWIINYIQMYEHVDIYNEKFVEQYVTECNPKRIEHKIYGSDYVPELGRYLAELYRQGVLMRFTIGLRYTHDGYPNWCYCYAMKSSEEKKT